MYTVMSLELHVSRLGTRQFCRETEVFRLDSVVPNRIRLVLDLGLQCALRPMTVLCQLRPYALYRILVVL